MTSQEGLQFIKFMLEEGLLKSSEIEFVRDVKMHILKRDFISKKQYTVLQQIYARSTGGGERAY